jgi:hypothetical protein
MPACAKCSKFARVNSQGLCEKCFSPSIVSEAEVSNWHMLFGMTEEAKIMRLLNARASGDIEGVIDALSDL